MAGLGDLVVNLVANTKQFAAGMNKAKGVVSDFALTATAAATAGAGVGLVKLAADAETLSVKFRVLLGSAQAADAMMRQIGEFAASTPFQKMDIAGAVQKLLAFNVPASRVMGTIRNIGDISALTGNRIGELAELYGKAHVQGRLFMEDINQLTGRGIPIIQELAKQFGVAESEVRKLVETGQVTADNIARAFADMTGAGGQFANGMKALSETTAGRFSTLKDNVVELGVQMGQFLLPAASATLDMLLRLVKSAAAWGREIVIVGGAILAATVAMRAITLATQAYAKAQAIALSLTGKAGWTQLAAGATAATLAIIALNQQFSEVNAGMAEGGAAARNAAGAIRQVENAARPAGQALQGLRDGGAEFKRAMEALETPVQRVNRIVAEFKAAMVAANKGIVWDAHPLLVALRESESGFTDTLQTMQDDLRVLRGEATETGIQLERFAALGVNPEQIQALKDLFAEREKLNQQQADADYWKQHQKALEQRAEAIKKAIETPQETLDKLKVEVKHLVDLGELSPEEAQRFIAMQQDKTPEDTTSAASQRTAGVMQKGSAEAMSTIVASMRSNPMVDQQKKANQALQAIVKNTKPKKASKGPEMIVAIQGAV